jgi:NAD(P)-dependent dehydrogenase (short-subunit alcohol dehydrogenase family)
VQELQTLASADTRVHVLQLDVADDESIRRAAEQVAAILGGCCAQFSGFIILRVTGVGVGLNVLVNNAGICDFTQAFGVATRQSMAEHYDINTIGPVMCVQVVRFIQIELRNNYKNFNISFNYGLYNSIQAFHSLLCTAASTNANQPLGARRALIHTR